MCKAPLCGKSHQEWFEISKDRAAQVLGDWADFMKKAEPYDSKGSLKNRWREVMQMIDGNGQVVTAKKLLEHYSDIGKCYPLSETTQLLNFTPQN